MKMTVTIRPLSSGEFMAFLKHRPVVIAFGWSRDLAIANLKSSVVKLGGYAKVMKG
jgi:hypothetical protein